MNICIIDDHRLFGEGLSDILRTVPGVSSVLVHEDSSAIIERRLIDKVQLILMDINMPVVNGYELLKKVRARFSWIKVIMVSVRQDFYSIEKARLLGAHGYIFKNSNRQSFIKAVEMVCSGNTYFEEQHSLPKEGFVFSNGKKIKLTRREVEILQLLTHELTTKEIAAKLFISENTVIGYRKNLFQKFEVKNMCGLIKYALELN